MCYRRVIARNIRLELSASHAVLISVSCEHSQTFPHHCERCHKSCSGLMRNVGCSRNTPCAGVTAGEVPPTRRQQGCGGKQFLQTDCWHVHGAPLINGNDMKVIDGVRITRRGCARIKRYMKWISWEKKNANFVGNSDQKMKRHLSEL